MRKPWKQVTVVGCGLIGASFALAVRAAQQCNQIFGWDTDANVLKEARDRGIIDEVDTAFDVGGKSLSGLIYLAMPVKSIISFFKDHATIAQPGCLITDSGSTKVDICRAAREYLSPQVAFVGGHPMAGSHLGGITHARADLFRDAPYMLVLEPPDCSTGLSDSLQRTLNVIGARVEMTTAEEHDWVMAYVSQLPQLLSSALAATVNQQIDSERLTVFAGPAYRDLARLSSSPWNIWHDILATNTANADEALRIFIELLQQVRSKLPSIDDCVSKALPEFRALFDQQTSTTLNS